MAKKRGGPKKHEEPQAGADQPVTSYRAMGGALTLEEVSLYVYLRISFMQPIVNGQDLSTASLIFGSFTFIQGITAVKDRAVHTSRIQTRIHGMYFVKCRTVPASKV